MFVNFFTTQDKLDTLLSDGIPMSDKSTNGTRKPLPIWLTKHPTLSPPSSEDLKFIVNLQPDPGRWPPGHNTPTSKFAFDGVVRVMVRIRFEQARGWLWRAIDDFDTMRSNAAAIYEFDDGWFVMEQAITPNQITRVDQWSDVSGEWGKIKLNRRLVLPAAVRRPPLLRKSYAWLRGDHHPVA